MMTIERYDPVYGFMIHGQDDSPICPYCKNSHAQHLAVVDKTIKTRRGIDGKTLVECTYCHKQFPYLDFIRYTTC